MWVLAGFGAQHRKMGKSLYLRDEMFAEWINKVDALVQDELGYSVVELILDDSQDYGIETTQVTIFAIQIALGELLKAHGAKPAAVVGQSLGEAAAAYFAGGCLLPYTGECHPPQPQRRRSETGSTRLIAWARANIPIAGLPTPPIDPSRSVIYLHGGVRAEPSDPDAAGHIGAGCGLLIPGSV